MTLDVPLCSEVAMVRTSVASGFGRRTENVSSDLWMSGLLVNAPPRVPKVRVAHQGGQKKRATWRDATLGPSGEHYDQRGFPLTGRHATTTQSVCAQCRRMSSNVRGWQRVVQSQRLRKLIASPS